MHANIGKDYNDSVAIEFSEEATHPEESQSNSRILKLTKPSRRFEEQSNQQKKRKKDEENPYNDLDHLFAKIKERVQLQDERQKNWNLFLNQRERDLEDSYKRYREDKRRLEEGWRELDKAKSDFRRERRKYDDYRSPIYPLSLPFYSDGAIIPFSGSSRSRPEYKPLVRQSSAQK